MFFSKDGKFIASGSLDKTVKIWEFSTGKLLKEFKGHSSVYSVSFSNDGKFIASGRDEKENENENPFSHYFGIKDEVLSSEDEMRADSPKPQWDNLFENESNERRFQNKEYIYPFVKKSKLEHFCDVLINIPLGLEQANNDFLFGCKDLILHPPSLKQIAIGFLHSPEAVRSWVEKFSVVSPGQKSRMLSNCVGDIALFWAGEEVFKLGLEAKKLSEFRKLSKLAEKAVKTGKYSEWVTSLSKAEKIILNDSFKKPIEWLVKNERKSLVSQIRSSAGKNIKPHLNSINTAKKTSTAAYKSLNVKDSNHFFTNIVDNYASYASKYKIKGGDGIIRTLYQIEGSLKNKSGIFEWIVYDGEMSHRRFIPKGKITGKPNQIIKK